MKNEQLQALCAHHKQDQNYQYRDFSWDQIDAMAAQSLKRLNEEHLQKLIKVCKQYGFEDAKVIARYRFMAQTNLFFLCKLLEKYKDTTDRPYIWTDGTTHNTHEEICNEFFVRKNPTFATFKEFAGQYIDKKERLLLVPRGGFKSSIDMADCVQWIINFPEVTILVLTGVLSLANDFVAEIKGHFTLEEGGIVDLFGKKALRPRRMNDGTLSLFQVLFP